MPDWMSHILIALILAELFCIKKRSLVMLGALAPDLLSKMHLVYFYFGIPPVISFVFFHTPVMMLLLSVLITPLFSYGKLKTMLFFNIGSMSHFLSDLFMKHFTIEGTRMLFPFLQYNYSLNLIWPDDSFYILIGGLIVYLILISAKRNLYKNKSNTPVV